MQSSGRRRAITRSNGVVAGSVWETRMRMDQVKGGIKVFNGDSEGNGDEEGIRVYQRLRRNQSDGAANERRKRRNWRPPDPVSGVAIEKNPIQLRKARSELSNSLRISDGNCGEFGDEKEEESGGEEEEEIEIEIETEGKNFDDKEIDLPVEKPKNVDQEKKIDQIQEVPISPDIENKPIQVIDLKKEVPDPINQSPCPIEVEEEVIEIIPRTPNKMQNIVDLVMWRDISKSAFVFGLGTFVLLSSSYAKDLNFSLIAAICYLGLVYLAVIFLYKSILRRGVIEEFDEGDERYVVGEEEAIWVLRLLLPYINEVLLKIRSLFSGDPATTMKLAVLLFVMARCGCSITTWTLAKLVFFGIFTIPKIFSSYSIQLARYGKFWMDRFRDGWESCTHKKAVAAAVFTLIWNLSSTVARIWAVFMLVVAVKFYQQCTSEDWNAGEEEEQVMVEEEERQEDSKAVVVGPQANGSIHRRRSGPRAIEMRREMKTKKWT